MERLHSSHPNFAGPFTKGVKGDFRREIHERREEQTDREDAILAEAKRRDRYACRYPGCQEPKGVVHGCHLTHRGMGGNPEGDRTTKDTAITFCPRHHQLFDHADFTVEPVTPRGTDGPCEFAVWNPKTRVYDFYARESSQQLSEERNPAQ